MAAKTYQVTGGQETLGHMPGEVFEADLDPDQETTLIQGGAISKSTDEPTVTTEEPVEEAAPEVEVLDEDDDENESEE